MTGVVDLTTLAIVGSALAALPILLMNWRKKLKFDYDYLNRVETEKNPGWERRVKRIRRSIDATEEVVYGWPPYAAVGVAVFSFFLVLMMAAFAGSLWQSGGWRAASPAFTALEIALGIFLFSLAWHRSWRGV